MQGPNIGHKITFRSGLGLLTSNEPQQRRAPP